MPTKYRFSINSHYVVPIYKDDLSKDFELEPQQRFYRPKLSGKIKLIKSDYDWLASQSFSTEFELLIEKSISTGVWTDYFTGVFYKTDCKWDESNKVVEIKVDTLDNYNEVLAKMEDEYNLIKLAPALTELQIQKRPLIQMYIPGDSVVGCFLGGNAWEQDVSFEVTSTSDLVNTYKFALASTLRAISVSGYGDPSAARGTYTGESETQWYNNGGAYRINRQTSIQYDFTDAAHGKDSSDIGSIWQDGNGNQWILASIPDINSLVMNSYLHTTAPPAATDTLTHVSGATHTGTITYSFLTSNGTKYYYTLTEVAGPTLLYVSGYYDAPVVNGTLSFKEVGGTDTLSGAFKTIEVYGRYLLWPLYFQDIATVGIPSDDIVANNRNYPRALGFAIDLVTIWNGTTSTPTEYGLADNGEYFEEPPGFPTYYKYYPVARSTWGNYSLWFNFDFLDFILEEEGRYPFRTKDSSLISDVIKVLLAEIDPTIIHDGTSTYSEFLYGTNPLTFGEFKIMLTQKSNILAGAYDQPAQKAPITLAMVMTMLKNCFQCYWYIDSSNRFRIEHVSWFKNGGAYSGSPLLTADLTTLTDSKVKKVFDLYQSIWEYDKEDLPERYEFKWMDDVTKGFEGYPIEINSKFVQRGKKEDINAGNFTSDIDYMLLNPSAINMDGFALMAATFNDTNLFDPDDPDFTPDYYVIYTNGTLAASSVFNASGYIPVKGEQWYSMSYIRRAAWYDSNKVYISGISTDINNPKTYQAPANARYIRTSIHDTELATFKFMEGFNLVGFYELPFIQRTIENADLRLQNGLVSWVYLHPNFWRNDLPASSVNINDASSFALDVMKKKKQNVKYPSIEDPDPMKLIKTSLGNGQIEKISVNLSSRMNEIQLKYDTEQ